MKSLHGADELDRRIDAALARLPQWQPPADFPLRLAAAAHRQHAATRVPPRSMRFGLALEQLGRLALVFVATALLALWVGFAIPWKALASQPMLLTLLCILALLVTGAALTGRALLRGREAAW